MSYLKLINLAGTGIATVLPEIQDRGVKPFASLVHLDLSKNRITGSIPSSLGLTKVNRLLLSGNHIQYQLPCSQMDQMRELQVLDISNNQIAGTLCPWTGLTKLERIELQFNSISGTVPMEWDQLQSLKIIRLNRNRLFGKLPDWENLSLLEVLDFDVQLPSDETSDESKVKLGSDYLPQSWGKLRSLKLLNIGENHRTWYDLQNTPVKYMPVLPLSWHSENFPGAQSGLQEDCGNNAMKPYVPYFPDPTSIRGYCSSTYCSSETFMDEQTGKVISTTFKGLQPCYVRSSMFSLNRYQTGYNENVDSSQLPPTGFFIGNVTSK
jgi:hypothetical protein